MKRITPQAAKELMDQEGYVYLDVRSIPEFEAGHPEGAYNVPLNHKTDMGMQPNLDFVAVVRANFPKDAKIVVGCKAGGRSQRAVMSLEQDGYTNLVDQLAGWSGGMNPETGLPEPGWQPAGLPSATKAGSGKDYEALAAKK